MSGVPILLDVNGLRVLVIGGGAVATRKAAQFANAGAVVRVVATVLSAELQSLALDGRVDVSERPYAAADIGDAQLVIAATDDRVVNASIAADARSASRLVNVADAGETGDFAVMASHVSGPLTIGVSAGGVPAASARIRDAIGERFGPRYSEALEAVRVVRSQLIGSGAVDEWRALSGRLLDETFCAAVDDGSFDERIRAWR